MAMTCVSRVYNLEHTAGASTQVNMSSLVRQGIAEAQGDMNKVLGNV